MERKMVEKEVDTISVEFATIGALHDELAGLIKVYGEDAIIKVFNYEYGGGEYFAVCAEILETDDEMNKRIAEEKKWEKKWEAAQEESDRRAYERYAAKHGIK